MDRRPERKMRREVRAASRVGRSDKGGFSICFLKSGGRVGGNEAEGAHTRGTEVLNEWRLGDIAGGHYRSWWLCAGLIDW